MLKLQLMQLFNRIHTVKKMQIQSFFLCIFLTFFRTSLWHQTTRQHQHQLSWTEPNWTVDIWALRHRS